MKPTILSAFLCCFLFGSVGYGQLDPVLQKPMLNPCIELAAPAPIRAMYVSKADDIINKVPPLMFGDINGNILLKWADDHNFNYLILYGISGELNVNEAAFTPKLAAFIKKAHEDYNIDISINVASTTSAGRMEDFLNSATVMADASMRFDALHYEAEYWNPSSGIVFDDGTADDYESQLTAIYNLCQSNGVDCETYIGNPTHGPDTGSWNPNPADPDNIQGQAEIDHINQHTDRIYVAYYKWTPFSPSGNIFQSKKYRFGFLQNSAYQSNIVVLFNSNNSSSDPHMYDWLDAQPGVYSARWPRPYNIWMNCNNGYNDHPDGSAGTDNVNVKGYCWYRFQNLRHITLWETHVQGPKFKSAQANKVIFPNPTKSILHLNQDSKVKVKSAQVFNTSGQLVAEFGEGNSIDVGNLDAGIYIVEVSYSDGEVLSERFTKE